MPEINFEKQTSYKFVEAVGKVRNSDANLGSLKEIINKYPDNYIYELTRNCDDEIELSIYKQVEETDEEFDKRIKYEVKMLYQDMDHYYDIVKKYKDYIESLPNELKQ